VQDLIDKSDIRELILNYALGLDTQNWSLLRSIFTGEVEFDFSSFNGTPPAKLPVDAWIAACQALVPGFDATQHLLTNFMIDVAGDTATTTVYVQAEHFIATDKGERSHTLGGYYNHRLVKSPDGWKISGLVFTVFWRRGDPQVYELAANVVASRN